jgi:hypothetical protein
MTARTTTTSIRMIRMRFISNGVPMNRTGSGKNSSTDGPQNSPGGHSDARTPGMTPRAGARIEASRAFS